MDFPPVHGTLNENQLLRAQQNQHGDTDLPFTVTVYLFLANNTMSRFIFTEFHDVRVSLLWQKTHGATHTSTKQGNPLTYCLYHTYIITYARIVPVARNNQQTTQSTRDTTQSASTEHT